LLWIDLKQGLTAGKSNVVLKLQLESVVFSQVGTLRVTAFQKPIWKTKSDDNLVKPVLPHQTGEPYFMLQGHNSAGRTILAFVPQRTFTVKQEVRE
jgi:hypothetical protein